MNPPAGPHTDYPERPPLLATKLFVPQPRQGLVPRPRLLARLDGCLSHGLTLVSAPAGFGKTTLVSAWARGLGRPVAWLSLDAGDNDPSRFLSYLVAALQQVEPSLGRAIPAALDGSTPPASLLALLANEVAALPDDLVLVLDDFHVIDDAALHEAIRDLVAHLPPPLHLLLCTREDPPLPLARLRAHGRLLELRAQDLRFAPQEAAAFLGDVMGVRLSPGDLERLDERVEGWAAGLQLVALSMRGHQDPAAVVSALSGGHHHTLSYLTEEVLARLPPERRSFLLETSVLTRLTGPLCDAVTGRQDGERTLEELYAGNVFVVPLDDGHRWYRYHHLFADLLRGQLGRAAPGLAPSLHRRAAEWYEAEGMAAEAIEHALAGEDHAGTVRLLEAHARPVLLQGHARTVENWLRRLPPQWRAAGPRANLAFAWSLLLRGRLAEIEPYLDAAEAAAGERRRSGAEAEAAAILAEAIGLRAGLVSVRGDSERGCELAREAAALAPADDPYLQGLVRFSLGTAYNYAGRADEAIAAYRDALPLARASGNTVAATLIVGNLALLYGIQGRLRAAEALALGAIAAAGRSGEPAPALATLHGAYGDVLFQRDELEAARRQLETALDLSRRGGHIATVAFTGVNLSRLHQALGDAAAAAAALEEPARLLGRGMPGWVAPQVVSQQAALALARDDAEAARRALEDTGVRLEDEASYPREVVHIAYLRLLLHLARREPGGPHGEQGLDLANRLLASAEPAGRMGRALEVLVLRALLHQARGDGDRARDDLERALAPAEPEGYVTLFTGEGPPMARLLRAVRDGAHRGYVERLLASFPRGPAAHVPAQPGLVEPLTEREIEVLRLMADGLTYREAAEALVVSLNTVRFHVKSIYGKLGVDRRLAAIEQARSLGLL